MSQFKDRLRECIDTKGVNAKKYANDIGISIGTASNYLSGKSLPDFEKLIRTIDYFEVSADWLLYGKSNIKSPSEKAEIEQIKNTLKLIVDLCRSTNEIALRDMILSTVGSEKKKLANKED